MFDTTDIDPRFGGGGEGDEALALIAAGLELLRSEERAGWSSAARSSRVLEVARAAERLQAESVRAVAAWDGNVAIRPGPRRAVACGGEQVGREPNAL